MHFRAEGCAVAPAGVSGVIFLASWQGKEKSRSRGRAALTPAEGQVKVGFCGPAVMCDGAGLG